MAAWLWGLVSAFVVILAVAVLVAARWVWLGGRKDELRKGAWDTWSKCTGEKLEVFRQLQGRRANAQGRRWR